MFNIVCVEVQCHFGEAFKPESGHDNSSRNISWSRISELCSLCVV